MVLPLDVEYPEWLQEVARRIDVLVQTPVLMEKFRDAVVDWAENLGCRSLPVEPGILHVCDPNAPGGRGLGRFVELLPCRALTREERLAGLAVIHDQIACGLDRLGNEDYDGQAVPIDPFWHAKRWLKDHPIKHADLHGAAEFMLLWHSISYYFLREEVCKLTDVQQKRVEEALHTTEKELRPADEPCRDSRQAESEHTIIVADDNNSVIVDGNSHRLRGADDGLFVRELLENRGRTIKAKMLNAKLKGTRPDRIYKRLPEELKGLIQPPGRGQTGYLMP